jgi:hypothetical protein
VGELRLLLPQPPSGADALAPADLKLLISTMDWWGSRVEQEHPIALISSDLAGLSQQQLQAAARPPLVPIKLLPLAMAAPAAPSWLPFHDKAETIYISLRAEHSDLAAVEPAAFKLLVALLQRNGRLGVDDLVELEQVLANEAEAGDENQTA